MYSHWPKNNEMGHLHFSLDEMGLDKMGWHPSDLIYSYTPCQHMDIILVCVCVCVYVCVCVCVCVFVCCLCLRAVCVCVLCVHVCVCVLCVCVLCVRVCVCVCVCEYSTWICIHVRCSSRRLPQVNSWKAYSQTHHYTIVHTQLIPWQPTSSSAVLRVPWSIVW